MENVSQPSNGTISERTLISTEKIIICVLLYLIVLITILGNVLVLWAIKVEKRLQTLFNYYVVNLAVTDIGVAVTAMSFYTLDITLGYWPFGEFMCAVWIFCDYGMTFASVFTLIIISVDRFWSVTWSLHYRTHHTRQKCFLIIAGVWLCVVILWLPACIIDRSKNQNDGVCIWEPSLNKAYVIIIAVVGYHGSFIILMFCYIRVLIFMYKRRVNPLIEINNCLSTTETVSTEPSGASTYVSTLPIPGTSRASQPMSTLPIPHQETQTELSIVQVMRVHGYSGQSTQAWSKDGTVSDRKPNKVKCEGKSAKVKSTSSGSKERKVFITLTYIIVGYVICWLPFHIVFDVSSIAPDQVPDTVFTIAFWLAYFNSTINPFLYNLAAPSSDRPSGNSLPVRGAHTHKYICVSIPNKLSPPMCG